MVSGDHRRSGGGSHDHRHHSSHHGSHGGGHHQSRGSHTRTFGDGADQHSEESHGLHHSIGGGGHGGGGGLMDATFVWKLSKLGRIGSSRLRFDDDFADRLNYQYTGVLLFLFIGLLGIRQYVGKPIQCWIPQEFNRGWEEYAENYCWVSNTYFAPLQNRLPPAADRAHLLIGYYQWAPIVMAIQAMCFYLPCLVWRLFMCQSGFNVRRILQMATDSNILLPEHTMKNVRFIARYMEGCIYRQRDHRRGKSDFSYTSPTGGGSKTVQLPLTQLKSQPPSAPPRYTPPGSDRGNGDAVRFDDSVHKSPAPSSRPKSSSWLSNLRAKLSGKKSNNRHRVSNNNNSSSRQPLVSAANNANEDGPKLTGGSPRHSTYSSHNVGDPTGSLYSSSTSPHHHSSPQPPSSLTKPPKSTSSDIQCGCGKRQGNYLVFLYFFVKILYLTNIIAQLFMMEKFVGNSYNFYGLQVLIDLIKGREWSHSGNFPRVTFCDFEAKKIGPNNRYTLQCVLPLNMFLEKIYIFLWFWHCMVGIVTLTSFIVWFCRLGFPHRRVKFIRNYLKIMSVLRDTDKQASTTFVENYLRPDGVLLLRLIAVNVGDMMAGDLACELWHIYRHKRLQQQQHIHHVQPGQQHPQVHHHHHRQSSQHDLDPTHKYFDPTGGGGSDNQGNLIEFMMLQNNSNPGNAGSRVISPSPTIQPIGFVTPASTNLHHGPTSPTNHHNSNNDDSIV